MVWLLGLGTYDISLYHGEDDILVWIFWFLATFTLSIVFLNMLIAIMSLTFDNTIIAHHEADKEKIGILADWSWVNKFSYEDRFEKANYMFSVKPIDEDSIKHDDEYVSRIKQLKTELKKNQKHDVAKFLMLLIKNCDVFSICVLNEANKFPILQIKITKWHFCCKVDDDNLRIIWCEIFVC